MVAQRSIRLHRTFVGHGVAKCSWGVLILRAQQALDSIRTIAATAAPGDKSQAELLRDHGFSTEGLRSKSWSEFAGPEAPQIDLIITVCDNAADERCPVWPGRPITAHWGIEDPAAVKGAGEREAFEQALRFLRNRIAALVSLPLQGLDKLALPAKLREIGASEGSTAAAREEPADG